MTSLEQRENAYETEFAHREELKFRGREKAVRALATWAAERLGKTAEAADAYATEIVAADVSHSELEATLESVAAALVPAGIRKAEVVQMMNRFLAQADAAVWGSPQPPR
jgi:hypothetical protein